MQVSQVNFLCADTEAAKAFYEHLGFSFRRISPAHLGAAYVSVAPDGVSLALHPADFAAWWLGQPTSTSPGDDVLDLDLAGPAELDDLVARLRALGHRIAKDPADMEWGERYAVVLDPDGRRIGLKAALA